MCLIYPTLEMAIEVHAKTIEVSGGGQLGILQQNQLESVLANIQNDDYYPTVDSKLTHLFHSACKFHCFADGNKRFAIALCAHFLILNGFLRCIKAFIFEAENISYHVASGAISKGLLQQWMFAVLEGSEDDEVLKLEILQAIAGGELQHDMP